MERMLGLFINNPVAAGAGAFGMLCLAAYPLFHARSLLLASYLGNNLAFATHYALLGQATAEIMNMVMGVQTLVAIGLARWPGLRWAYYSLVPLLLGAAMMTWQGWVSLLSTTATALSTLGRMQGRETVLRAFLLASAPLWAVHDLLAGSLPGLIADVACTATGAWMLLQQLRRSET
jgi:Bacterial inner membrane protein